MCPVDKKILRISLVALIFWWTKTYWLMIVERKMGGMCELQTISKIWIQIVSITSILPIFPTIQKRSKDQQRLAQLKDQMHNKLTWALKTNYWLNKIWMCLSTICIKDQKLKSMDRGFRIKENRELDQIIQVAKINNRVRSTRPLSRALANPIHLEVIQLLKMLIMADRCLKATLENTLQHRVCHQKWVGNKLDQIQNRKDKSKDRSQVESKKWWSLIIINLGCKICNRRIIPCMTKKWIQWVSWMVRIK